MISVGLGVPTIQWQIESLSFETKETDQPETLPLLVF